MNDKGGISTHSVSLRFEGRPLDVPKKKGLTDNSVSP